MKLRSNPSVILAVLTALNFLNFIDRSILFQVQPLIQREFGVSKLQIGLLTTAFMICFVAAAPVLGWLADHYPRRPIMATGAILWSLATLLTAITSDFHTLLIRHAIVGIGEACMVAAPAYIADLYPAERRGRMLGILFMAVPAGTALGFLVGGVLGHAYGWRAPFYVVAGPGVVAALLLLCTREPQRGAQDGMPETVEHSTVLGLARNGAYISATAGMSIIAFALGAAQVWFPDFLVSVRGMTMLGAGIFIAAIAIVNGIAAPLTGGSLADLLRRRRSDADYTVSAVAMAIAVPLMVASLYTARPAMFVAIALTHFLLVFSYVPLLAISVRSVSPEGRTTAIAVQGVVVHLLGDATSAPLVGHIADVTGSLQWGLMMAVAAVAAGAAILFYGGRFALRRVAPRVAAVSTTG